MSAGQSRRNRNRRKARPGGESTYDGVSDSRIYERDFWACQMPECLCPHGRPISPASFQRKQGTVSDPWRASIDHIIPLADGGWDIAANKRAAHQLCNEAAAQHYPREHALSLAAGKSPAGSTGHSGLTYAISDVIDLAALVAADPARMGP